MRVLLVAVILLVGACKKEAPTPPHPAPPPPKAVAGEVELAVTDKGFEPTRIPAKAGVPLILAITRKTDATCAKEILFQGQEAKTDLPLNQTVKVTYTPKVSGEVKFGCAMGMMIGGVLAVTD